MKSLIHIVFNGLLLFRSNSHSCCLVSQSLEKKHLKKRCLWDLSGSRFKKLLLSSRSFLLVTLDWVHFPSMHRCIQEGLVLDKVIYDAFLALLLGLLLIKVVNALIELLVSKRF